MFICSAAASAPSVGTPGIASKTVSGAGLLNVLHNYRAP